jgi:putative transposase
LQYTATYRNGGAPRVGFTRGGLVMPKGLKRYYGRGDLHFLTFSCYRRLPLLKTMRARNLFVKALGRIRERYKFLLVGYVVMPNHVHLLISETAKATPSMVLKVLKQRTSRDFRRVRRGDPKGQLRLAFAKGEESLERFWQPRFYDFNVWSVKKVREKLEYMHANPVTRKLVSHPKGWRWSSWSFYAKGEAGLVPIDPVG